MLINLDQNDHGVIVMAFTHFKTNHRDNAEAMDQIRSLEDKLLSASEEKMSCETCFCHMTIDAAISKLSKALNPEPAGSLQKSMCGDRDEYEEIR